MERKIYEFTDEERKEFQVWLKNEIKRQKEKIKRRESLTILSIIDNDDSKTVDETEKENCDSFIGQNLLPNMNKFTPRRFNVVDNIDESNVKTYLRFLGNVNYFVDFKNINKSA